jgi:Transglutaminase-like superfamily
MQRRDARLYVERLGLVAEVLVTYVIVRWQVRRHDDLPQAVAALREERRRKYVAVIAREPRALAAAAERVVARIPGDSRCLMRSLVVLAMLARRGVDARLVLAARPTPEFAAHAWVERDGDPLLPTRGYGDARLAEL